MSRRSILGSLPMTWLFLLIACGAPAAEPDDLQSAPPDLGPPALDYCRPCRPGFPDSCPLGRCQVSPDGAACCVGQPFPLMCRWGACTPTPDNRCTVLGGRCEPVPGGHCCNFLPPGSHVP